eukprot:gene80-88_t
MSINPKIFFTGLTLATAVDVGGRSVFNHLKSGKDWQDGRCPIGNYQSPIDLPYLDPNEAHEAPETSFSYRYRSFGEPIDVVNTGHGLSVDLLDKGIGGVTFDGKWYDALAINLHSKGEHTFAGARPAAEVEIVHKRFDSSAMLVTSFPLVAKVDPAEPDIQELHVDHPERNLFVSKNGTSETEEDFIESFKVPKTGSLGMETFDEDPVLIGLSLALDEAVPKMHESEKVSYNPLEPFGLNYWFDESNSGVGTTFLHYSGSLTTPPCAEDVQWLVRADPVRVSNDQIRTLYSAITNIVPGGNYRAIQKKSMRQVNTVQSKLGPELSDASLPYQKEVPKRLEPSSRADKVNMMAGDAVHRAQQTVGYMVDLDKRLRMGAKEYARVVHGEPLKKDARERFDWNAAAKQIYDDVHAAVTSFLSIF